MFAGIQYNHTYESMYVSHGECSTRSLDFGRERARTLGIIIFVQYSTLCVSGCGGVLRFTSFACTRTLLLLLLLLLPQQSNNNRIASPDEQKVRRVSHA